MADIKNNKMSREEEKEILQGIQNQIGSFDNKASIFLATVGIVFALSSSFIEIFHSEWFIKLEDITYKGWYKGIFIAFVIVSFLIVLSFILVLRPRKKTIDKIYGNYYKDIAKSKREDLNIILDEFVNDDELLIDQIKINSNICDKKHFYLVCGELLFIPFIILLSSMVLMIVNK
jgi:hypothetical protein